MSKTILVGCRLPCGIVLDGAGKTVELNGANTSYVPGAPGLTHVDAAQWDYIKVAYASHAAFVNESIFATGSDKPADIADAAEDLKDEKTGFEGLDPAKPGVLLKPENEQKLSKALEANAGPAPRKAPQTKADKAAALALATGG